MSRPFVITLILCMGLILPNCAVLEKMDGSSKDEIEKFKMSKGEMWNELKKARNENIRLRDQVRTLQEGNQRITDENKRLAIKLHTCQLAHGTSLSESHEKAISKIRMKALSGDGDLNSAKEMAKRLRGAGYNIKIFHHANRSDYLCSTVYCLPTFLREAKRLVLLLGEHTIIKPLTWPSAYDIIVVTGKNP